MRVPSLLAALFTFTLFAVCADAQTPVVRLTLADNSQVRGELLCESITAITPYGSLTIPASEVRSIKFGIHVNDQTQVNTSVKALSSASHKEREVATQWLITLGRSALPSIRLAMKSTDMETKLRALGIHDIILERDEGAASAATLDLIVAKSMTVHGKIQLDALKVRSGPLGELTVKLADCRMMANVSAAHGAITIDAAKHGDQWLDTDFHVDKGNRLVVKASGSVELWPQQPGQHVCSPKGINTAGKGGQFMAGVLVGKIGAEGTAFYIGERYDGLMTTEGKLYLLIVASPWNNVSSGSYRAEFSVGD